MTTEETEKSPLWDALARTRPAPVESAVGSYGSDLVSQPTTIVDRLISAWLSGFLPLLVLYLGGVYVSVPSREPFLLASSLFLGPLVAWGLSSLVSGVHGVTPTRFLGAALALMWVIPVTQMGPTAVFTKKGLIWGVSRQAHTLLSWPILILGLGLTAVLLLVSYWIRSKAVWYDQAPPQRRSELIGWALVIAPILLYLLLLLVSRPSAEVKNWEAEVLQAQPELQELRMSYAVNHTRDWRDLEKASKVLGTWNLIVDPPTEVAKLDLVKRIESRALELSQRKLVESWDRSEAYDARRVFSLLMQRAEYLEYPARTLKANLQTSINSGRPHYNSHLTEFLEAQLQKEDKATLGNLIEVYESLIQECPDRVWELDRRSFLRHGTRSPHRTFKFSLLGPYDPESLVNDYFRHRRISEWLVVRPFLQEGTSWTELLKRDDLSEEVRDAIHRLTPRDANITHQDRIVPRLQAHRLVCQIQRHQLKTGALPVVLGQVEGVSVDPQRWSWYREDQGWVLFDSRLRDLGGSDYQWSFR